MKLDVNAVHTTQVDPFDLYYSQALVVIATTDLTCRVDQIPAAALKLAEQAFQKRQEFLRKNKKVSRVRPSVSSQR